MKRHIPIQFRQHNRFAIPLQKPPPRSRVDSADQNDSASRERNESVYSIYLREISQIPLLSREEEIELTAKARRGDPAARESMITANLRLVVKIARDFEGFGLPLLDLISEGNCGLMKAVDRYEPDHGAKLSSYAAWWIKHAIKRALANQSRTIRLPVHTYETLVRMRRFEMQLHQRLGRAPSTQELAHQLKMPLKKVAHLIDMAVPLSSLDESSDENKQETLGSRIADPNAMSSHDIVADRTRQEWLTKAIANLSRREATILAGRFGLRGTTVRTLESLGSDLGLTREAIRQIQNSALKKLRRAMEHWESIAKSPSNVAAMSS